MKAANENSPVEPVRVALVVAAGLNGVIGRNGALPWRMPSDLKGFRRLTLGKPMVMGRKTYDSIGRPLDGRDSIVITRDPAFRPDGVIVAASVVEALTLANAAAGRRQADEIMVIGGAEIFRQTLPIADRIYLTRIDARPDGDVLFPDPAALLWHVVRSEPLTADPRDEHTGTLNVYERR